MMNANVIARIKSAFLLLHLLSTNAGEIILKSFTFNIDDNVMFLLLYPIHENVWHALWSSSATSSITCHSCIREHISFNHYFSRATNRIRFAGVARMSWKNVKRCKIGLESILPIRRQMIIQNLLCMLSRSDMCDRDFSMIIIFSAAVFFMLGEAKVHSMLFPFWLHHVKSYN